MGSSSKFYGIPALYHKLHGVPDVISFDHDLGDEHYAECENTPGILDTAESEIEKHYSKFTEKTGYDCTKWLIEHKHLPQTCIVHSMNPVGKKNIEFILNGAYKREKN
jgi:hypothetical protein